MAARLTMHDGPALARLAVIVPVGPGDAIEPALRAQLGALPEPTQVFEIHAGRSWEGLQSRYPSGKPRPEADGFSMGIEAEASPTEVRQPQWRVLHASHGRAAQQNAGARAADREWLWFLHADSALAAETLPALEDFIDTHANALGYFDLRFLDDGPALMRINAFGARLRSRWFGLPFGDQGFVLPRAAFERLGGFDTALAIGEDHDLVWRARRARLPLRPIGAPLFTSARKYAERGWCRTTLSHVAETWRQARRFSHPQASR